MLLKGMNYSSSSEISFFPPLFSPWMCVYVSAGVHGSCVHTCKAKNKQTKNSKTGKLFSVATLNRIRL